MAREVLAGFSSSVLRVRLGLSSSPSSSVLRDLRGFSSSSAAGSSSVPLSVLRGLSSSSSVLRDLRGFSSSSSVFY